MIASSPFPLLSSIIFLPLFGAMAIAFVNEINVAKKIALFIASLEFILTLLLLFSFNHLNGDFQWMEKYQWIPSLQAEFLLGVDGISILFLPMSALLTLITLVASWNSVHKLTRLHFALLLILESVTMGVFTALDMLLFFLFWEATLPPIFFLIGLWGIGAQRRAAALKYTLYMLCGGVPILFAIMILAINHASQTDNGVLQGLTFSFPALLQTPLAQDLQPLVFLLLVAGFAVKAPLVPFHTWLPTVAMEAPTQLTALLTGLKLGAFGLLRFALPLAPDAASHYAWIVALLGAITLVYAALIALQQTNLRQLLAYLSISHVGLVIVGIASLNMQAMQGAIFQLLNFSMIASGLMLIAGFMQQRLGSTELVHLGGLAKIVPRLTAFFFLFSFASIGIPLTSGFPAELLLIIGALKNHLGLGLTGLCGAILGAAAMLLFMRRAFLGIVVHEPLYQTHDLRQRELWLLGLPMLLVLALGLCPSMILDTTYSSVQVWLNRFVGAT
jgi:NADH-quinone oxidoreductase subunit M